MSISIKCYYTVLNSTFFCAAVRVSVAGNDDSAIKVVEGQGMSMTCTTVNLPAGVTVQRYHWMHMNQAVSNANSVMLHGSRNESLAILSLSYIIHLGDYQCGITLSTGERHHSNIITLKASKSIIIIMITICYKLIQLQSLLQYFLSMEDRQFLCGTTKLPSWSAQ